MPEGDNMSPGAIRSYRRLAYALKQRFGGEITLTGQGWLLAAIFVGRSQSDYDAPMLEGE